MTIESFCRRYEDTITCNIIVAIVIGLFTFVITLIAHLNGVVIAEQRDKICHFAKGAKHAMAGKYPDNMSRELDQYYSSCLLSTRAIVPSKIGEYDERNGFLLWIIFHIVKLGEYLFTPVRYYDHKIHKATSPRINNNSIIVTGTISDLFIPDVVINKQAMDPYCMQHAFKKASDQNVNYTAIPPITHFEDMYLREDPRYSHPTLLFVGIMTLDKRNQVVLLDGKLYDDNKVVYAGPFVNNLPAFCRDVEV